MDFSSYVPSPIVAALFAKQKNVTFLWESQLGCPKIIWGKKAYFILWSLLLYSNKVKSFPHLFLETQNYLLHFLLRKNRFKFHYFIFPAEFSLSVVIVELKE